MATSAYASTSETTNMNRTSRVLLGPCTDQLRDVLRHRIPPRNFPHVMKQLRRNLPRLTQPQIDQILPRGGHYSGDYSDMDLSLMYLLLRNICNIQSHSKGWGNSPDVLDHSLSANIESIREARNQIGHSFSLCLSQTDFDDIWLTIKTSVISMDAYLNNGNKYEKEVDFLRTETMDPEQELYYAEELRRQMADDTQTRDIVTKVQHSLGTLEHDIENQEEIIGSQQEEIRQLKSQQRESQGQLKSLTDSVQTQIATLEMRNERQDKEIVAIRHLYYQEPVKESDVIRLKQRLVEINDYEAREIPLSPLQEDGDKLPIEKMFASVVINEDSKETRKGSSSEHKGNEQEPKELKSPEHLLTKDGKPVRRVFMLGDAAHGKTTYCMWLLKNWCNAQLADMSKRPLNEWESALSEFDFVFYLPLRHVDPSRANVTEMICRDILESDSSLQTVVEHVLSYDKYRCFILMDGLDEWKPNQSAKDKLRYKAMPNIENLSNCIIFTTMRPWIFAAVARLVRFNDRIIELQGFDEKGIEGVIEKVLEHYYEMNLGTEQYKSKCKKINSKLQDKTLKSVIQIPLLAVACAQIWFEGEDEGGSMTSFYASIVDMLIERAHLKHESSILLNDQTINITLPKKLFAKKNIKNFIKVLSKLGKIAFEGLLSKQMKLVFQKYDLEIEIGEKELQFVLDVGLISQREAPSVISRKVSVHFLHKSIQEFLVGMYIVTQNDMSDSFSKHLSDVKAIMELSNVIMFICGICPSMGSSISQRVVRVIGSDTNICRYRASLGQVDSTVIELYKQQISWYKELKHEQTDNQVAFYVSDIYLDENSNKETVGMTKDFLVYHNDDIMSLHLGRVPIEGECGITNQELNNFLSNKDKTRSLISLYINGNPTKTRYVHTISAPSLKFLELSDVSIQDSCPDRNIHASLLKDMSTLKELTLRSMNVGDKDLGLTSNMVAIQNVSIDQIKMAPLGWRKFLHSLVDIKHSFSVTLTGTDIDHDSMTFIRSSSHFHVTYDDYVTHDNVCNDISSDRLIYDFVDDHYDPNDFADDDYFNLHLIDDDYDPDDFVDDGYFGLQSIDDEYDLDDFVDDGYVDSHWIDDDYDPDDFVDDGYFGLQSIDDEYDLDDFVDDGYVDSHWIDDDYDPDDFVDDGYFGLQSIDDEYDPDDFVDDDYVDRHWIDADYDPDDFVDDGYFGLQSIDDEYDPDDFVDDDYVDRHWIDDDYDPDDFVDDGYFSLQSIDDDYDPDDFVDDDYVDSHWIDDDYDPDDFVDDDYVDSHWIDDDYDPDDFVDDDYVYRHWIDDDYDPDDFVDDDYVDSHWIDDDYDPDDFVDDDYVDSHWIDDDYDPDDFVDDDYVDSHWIDDDYDPDDFVEDDYVDSHWIDDDYDPDDFVEDDYVDSHWIDDDYDPDDFVDDDYVDSHWIDDDYDPDDFVDDDYVDSHWIDDDYDPDDFVEDDAVYRHWIDDDYDPDDFADDDYVDSHWIDDDYDPDDFVNDDYFLDDIIENDYIWDGFIHDDYVLDDGVDISRCMEYRLQFYVHWQE